jgi:lipoprotein-anchoring transpeptidase ErfK/SrfK
MNAMAEDRSAELRIVVSIPDHKLVVMEGDSPLRIYDIAVGKRSTPTPQGVYVVVNRLVHPTWWGPRGVVPPGRANPLGTRWLGLSVKGFGIHGTNAPKSIGKHASHGCIRMRNRDVEELFEMVPVGVTVELVGERTEPLQKLLADAD